MASENPVEQALKLGAHAIAGKHGWQRLRAIRRLRKLRTFAWQAAPYLTVAALRGNAESNEAAAVLEEALRDLPRIAWNALTERWRTSAWSYPSTALYRALGEAGLLGRDDLLYFNESFAERLPRDSR